MPETTTYADVLREAFQGYYEFIIKESSCGKYKDYHEAYNEKLKPYIEILAKENLLLSMPDGKKITCFEDVKALDRELFHCWPYYSYEEMDEKGYYTIGVFGGKERKVYNSSLMNNRSAKLKEYFHIQYVDCLKKLDAIERGIQPVPEKQFQAIQDRLDIIERNTQLAPERQSNGQGVPDKDVNIFHKEGDYWTIQYNGKLTRINHYIGLKYIAYLLENKDKDFYVHEVTRTVNTKQFHAIQNSLKSGLKGQDDSFDNNQEIDIYDQNITVGTLKDYHETLRKRVKKNITDALANIKGHDNELWKHLNNSIHTGTTLSYTPKDSIQWNVKR